MYLIGRLGIIPDERRQAMENKMFCFQCQETAGGNGCTFAGVCGKKPEVAAMQDLLVYVTKGLGAVAALVVLVDNALHQLTLWVRIHAFLHQSGAAVVAISHLVDDILLGMVVNDTTHQLTVLTLGVVIHCSKAATGCIRGAAHATPPLLTLINGTSAIRVAHHAHHITGFIHDFGTLGLHCRQHRHHSSGNRQHPSVNHSLHGFILPIRPLIGKRKVSL